MKEHHHDANPAAAYSSAVVEQSAGLARLAFLVTGSRDVAEDLVAQTFATVWPRWARGEIDNLGGYLRVTLIHLAKRQQRRAWPFRLILPDPARTTSLENGVVDRVDVRRALLELSVEQRAILALRYLEDRTEAEVAEILGIPLGTVKSRTSRAVESMRTKMLKEQS